MREQGLHTICEEAACPNIGECWGEFRTASFLLLGDVCTRNCGFCAAIFAATIRQLKRRDASVGVEVLIPDFQGNWDALATVMDAQPDILNHNLETVPRLYSRVRPKAVYAQSLELLHRARELSPRTPTKSGLMVGLGETRDELLTVFADLRAQGVDVLTVGQYLRPTLKHLPVERYVAPEEFTELKAHAKQMGFRHVESAPLVRSSYHAHAQLQ
jgi:lipoic acid synthetase